eukprot:gene4571-14751_t
MAARFLKTSSLFLGLSYRGVPARFACSNKDKNWGRTGRSKKVRGRPEDLTLAEGSRAAGRPRPRASPRGLAQGPSPYLAREPSPDAALGVICDRCHGVQKLELKRLGSLALQHEEVLPAAVM